MLTDDEYDELEALGHHNRETDAAKLAKRVEAGELSAAAAEHILWAVYPPNRTEET